MMNIDEFNKLKKKLQELENDVIEFGASNPDVSEQSLKWLRDIQDLRMKLISTQYRHE